MHKIITLYQRNYDGDRLVCNKVTPGAEWVLAGEGTPTIKWDGTSCLVRNGKLYKRYDARVGRTPPAGFEPAQYKPDPITGHWPGWLLVSDGPEDRWHREAFEWHNKQGDNPLPTWTYELIGPKVQGNPYKADHHKLIEHGYPEIEHLVPTDFDALRDYLAHTHDEGIVWWYDISSLHCKKVKIKRKDFGLEWPIK
jgi:hypothetical protein